MLQISTKRSVPLGPYWMTQVTLALDASYPLTASGGYVLDRLAFKVHKILIAFAGNCSGGYSASVDAGNILHLYRTALGDGNAFAAGPQSEVTNGVDLHLVTVDLLLVTLGGNPTP